MSEGNRIRNNRTLPENPEHLDSDCESVTHYCGQCGKK